MIGRVACSLSATLRARNEKSSWLANLLALRHTTRHRQHSERITQLPPRTKVLRAPTKAIVELETDGVQEGAPGSVIPARLRFVSVVPVSGTLGIPALDGDKAKKLAHGGTAGVVFEVPIRYEGGIEWAVELGPEGGVEGSAINRGHVESFKAG